LITEAVQSQTSKVVHHIAVIGKTAEPQL